MMNRRDFLISAVQSGAALAAAAPALAARGRMYVSLNGSLTGYKIAWPDFARLAAKTGYGGVDLNLEAAMKEGPEATRALLKELKLRPACCGCPVNVGRDEAAFQAGMERLDEAARFAAAVGCNRMTAILPAGSRTPKDELLKRYTERYTAVGTVLAKHDVRLGFEFLGPLHLRARQPFEFLWRMNDVVAFCKECGPNMGLLLDAWHWHHAGGTVEDILKAGKSRIVTVHVSDCARMAPEDVKDNQRLLAGEGVIDLVGFFQALKKVGYTDGVSPEPLGRIPAGTSPEEGARLGLESTLTAIRKAGVATSSSNGSRGHSEQVSGGGK
jgi:sugar phosphate isomerase/epimerase